MFVALFRLHTACLHQAMRSTGYEKPYKALWSAVIGCFSTAVIGAFPSFLQLSPFSQLSCCCVSWLWASMLLEFQFKLSLLMLWGLSLMWIGPLKLYLIPNGIVPGVVSALWNGVGGHSALLPPCLVVGRSVAWCNKKTILIRRR